VDNANATGDGAVANAGDGDVNAATGDHSQVIDGDNLGQANTGDGAVQIQFGDGEGGHDIGPINTGINGGIIADGNVEDSVVGDHNTTANVDGNVDGVVNFGDGDVTNVSHSDLNESNVAGHDVHDSDSHDTNTSTVNADNSVVGVGQDDSQVHQHEVDNSHDLGHRVLEPVRLEHHEPVGATDGAGDGGDGLN
jgi:hypothetical protein